METRNTKRKYVTAVEQATGENSQKDNLKHGYSANFYKLSTKTGKVALARKSANGIYHVCAEV